MFSAGCKLSNVSYLNIFTSDVAVEKRHLKINNCLSIFFTDLYSRPLFSTNEMSIRPLNILVLTKYASVMIVKSYNCSSCEKLFEFSWLPSSPYECFCCFRNSDFSSTFFIRYFTKHMLYCLMVYYVYANATPNTLLSLNILPFSYIREPNKSSRNRVSEARQPSISVVIHSLLHLPTNTFHTLSLHKYTTVL